MKVKAYAAMEAKGTLTPFEFELGLIGKDEVDIRVSHCGICHSDLSMLNNDWRNTTFPFVGGHELVGEIIAIGDQVNHLQVGQQVGVGWTSSTCQTCDQCIKGDHNFCNQSKGTIVGRFGGFAEVTRAQSQWVFPLPEGLDATTAGPLFCGGITVFNPLLQHRISPMAHVGVVGIGGLGHMALRFLKAWGCEITAFSTSPDKESEAKALGAHHFVSTHDSDALKKMSGELDMVLDTVNVELDWNNYLRTLKPRGKLHIVGVAPSVTARIGHLMGRQKSITASPTGSPSSIRSMLQFAARHKIAPMVEHFKFSEINEAFERLRSGKTRYRIVLS